MAQKARIPFWPHLAPVFLVTEFTMFKGVHSEFDVSDAFQLDTIQPAV